MKRGKKQRRIMFLLILILAVSIGFALLSTTLKINGISGIKGNTWNIHWDDTSINVANGSVSANNPVVSTTTSTDDTVSFDVELELPGDFYEFEIDAINEGSVDGALELRENWITYIIDNEAASLPDYLNFSVTYDDDSEPQAGDVLKAEESQTYKIRVEYKASVDSTPVNPKTVTIEIRTDYKQHKEECPEPNSFYADSWSTIACNVRKGKTEKYALNSVRTIDMGEYGIQPIMIINKTTPSECSDSNFSQSACGFVLGFLNSVDVHEMKPSSNGGGGDNTGGWESSSMRTYINSTIYNKLPPELKKVIVNTKVVSGHGSSDNNNYVTSDKLYLLSIKEIYGRNSDGMDEFYSDTIGEDTASIYSRQLDRYSYMNATVHGYSNYTGLAKTYNNGQEWWWTRSPRKTFNDNYYGVMGNGVLATDNTSVNHGVAPAFKIG